MAYWHGQIDRECSQDGCEMQYSTENMAINMLFFTIIVTGASSVPKTDFSS